LRIQNNCAIFVLNQVQVCANQILISPSGTRQPVKMQILKIRLSEDDKQTIYNHLIWHFTTEDNPQRIYWHLNEPIEYESKLELYTEYPEPDENNQTAISSRSVVKFQITFFHDGEEVEVDDWDIDDRIKKYYEV